MSSRSLVLSVSTFAFLLALAASPASAEPSEYVITTPRIGSPSKYMQPAPAAPAAEPVLTVEPAPLSSPVTVRTLEPVAPPSVTMEPAPQAAPPATAYPPPNIIIEPPSAARRQSPLAPQAPTKPEVQPVTSYPPPDITIEPAPAKPTPSTLPPAPRPTKKLNAPSNAGPSPNAFERGSESFLNWSSKVAGVDPASREAAGKGTALANERPLPRHSAQTTMDQKSRKSVTTYPRY